MTDTVNVERAKLEHLADTLRAQAECSEANLIGGGCDANLARITISHFASMAGLVDAMLAAAPKAVACRECGGKGYTEYEGGGGEGYASHPVIDNCSLCAGYAPKVEQEPVGEVVLFGGDLKEIAWRKGKLPPVGAKLYTHPAPASDELLPEWAELQRLAEAASPGPWKACATIYEHMNCEIRTGAKGEGQPIGQIWDGSNAFADGQFIAAASPQVVLKLLSIAQHKGPQS